MMIDHMQIMGSDSRREVLDATDFYGKEGHQLGPLFQAGTGSRLGMVFWRFYGGICYWYIYIYILSTYMYIYIYHVCKHIYISHV